MQLRRTACATILGLGLLAAGLTPRRMTAAQAQEFHLEIIAFNDFHGNLESPGKFQANAQSPEVPVGGIDYFGGYVEHLKSLNPDNIVVSAGDLTGGSPLLSALFHEEDTIEAMNRLGLTINGVGNHEFDKGKQELLRLQKGGCATVDTNTCKGNAVGTPVPFEGAKFEYLAANVIDTSTGKTIFPGYAIRTWHGVKVAFIGVTLKDTPANSTPSAMAGLRFTDEADAINAIVRQLRTQGVKNFVALIHQGGYQTTGKRGDIKDIDGCAGGLNGYPIQPIVSRLDNAVDLVLSAHTHEAYICQMPNSSGRMIPVTSASSYGRVLTQIDMTIDKVTKQVKAVTAHNILVDRTNPSIKPDPVIKSIEDRYLAIAAPLINRVVGSITADITKPAIASGESPLGDLIADAQLEATAAPASGGAVAAFMNEAGFRVDLPFHSGTPGVADGKVTYGELFDTQPFSNNLVTMTLTGAQIRIMLEEQFKGCALGAAPGEKAPDGDRWLLVSEGFAYTFSKSAPPCSKVDPASIKVRGVTVSPSAPYRITVNSFLADGGGEFYVFKKGTDRLVGPVDIDATVAYFAKHGSVAPIQPHRVTALP
jgi:5'-nucleotidase